MATTTQEEETPIPPEEEILMDSYQETFTNFLNEIGNNKEWTNVECLASIKLCEVEEMPDIFKDVYRETISTASNRSSFFPRIYPSKLQWTYDTMNLPESLKDTLTLYKISGFENDQVKTRYFINLKLTRIFAKLITDVYNEQGYTPFFNTPPEWNVSQHKHTNGMTQEEALKQSRLFRSRAEACCLELLANFSGKMNNEIFLRPNRWKVYDMQGPLWIINNPEDPETRIDKEQITVPLQPILKERTYHPLSFTPMPSTRSLDTAEARVRDSIALYKLNKPRHSLGGGKLLDEQMNEGFTYSSRPRTSSSYTVRPYDRSTDDWISKGGQYYPSRMETATSTPIREQRKVKVQRDKIFDLTVEAPSLGNSVVGEPYEDPLGENHEGGNDRDNLEKQYKSIFSPDNNLQNTEGIPTEFDNPRSWRRPPGGGSPGGGPPGGGPPGGGPIGGNPYYRQDPFGNGRHRGGPGGPGGPGGQGPHGNQGQARPLVLQDYHFERKLKTDLIPEWDGDPQTLLNWIRSVNYLAELSDPIFDDLGIQVPFKFTDRALKWFQALPINFRQAIQINWNTLKNAVRDHFMDRHYLDVLKGQALRARYRQKGNEDETPSDYFYRKLELLELTVQMTEPEFVIEIMRGAPMYWEQFIDIQQLFDVHSLQNAIKTHEVSLLKAPDTFQIERRLKALENRGSGNSNRFTTKSNKFTRNFKPRPKGKSFPKKRTKSFAIGFHPSIQPKYPRDDNTISKNGRTPESKGARPCRHCGSPKHWDPECKYPKQDKNYSRKAKAHLAGADEEYTRAYSEYENLYQESDEESAEVNIAEASDYSSNIETVSELSESDSEDIPELLDTSDSEDF
jgi:hypothetical protein